MRKKRQGLDLSPGHALYVLERAIADRKISAADMKRYVSRMRDEIVELEGRLAALTGSITSPAKRLFGRRPGRPGKRRTARRVVSAKRSASQKLQGQYLGYMRQIPKGERKRFSTIAKDKGREPAIAAMKKRLGK